MVRVLDRDRPSSSLQSQLGGATHIFHWQWQEQALTVAYETIGEGAPVLLLPAFSTVSNRAELQDLATGLASHLQVTALDWPGFGESDRLPLDYGPALYTQFLQDFVAANFTMPIAIVAAGHAAGYALALAHHPPHLSQTGAGRSHLAWTASRDGSAPSGAIGRQSAGENPRRGSSPL